AWAVAAAVLVCGAVLAGIALKRSTAPAVSDAPSTTASLRASSPVPAMPPSAVVSPLPRDVDAGTHHGAAFVGADPRVRPLPGRARLPAADASEVNAAKPPET